MQKHIGWLWIVGFFSLLNTAGAQTSSPSTAAVKFDGTYAFVSSTKVDETMVTTQTNRLLRCPDITAGPLTIVNGNARYTDTGGGGREFEGTVESRGELAMRSSAVTANHIAGMPSIVMVSGRIDGDGTVRARRMGQYCRHDFIWRKESR